MVNARRRLVQGVQDGPHNLPHLVNQLVYVADHAVHDVAHRQNLLRHAIHGGLNLGNGNVQRFRQFVDVAMKAVNQPLQILQLDLKRGNCIDQSLLYGLEQIKQLKHQGGDVGRKFLNHLGTSISHIAEFDLYRIGFIANALADFSDALASFVACGFCQGAQIGQNLFACHW